MSTGAPGSRVPAAAARSGHWGTGRLRRAGEAFFRHRQHRPGSLADPRTDEAIAVPAGTAVKNSRCYATMSQQRDHSARGPSRKTTTCLSDRYRANATVVRHPGTVPRQAGRGRTSPPSTFTWRFRRVIIEQETASKDPAT